MNDERFDALWADMKARVKEAREKRVNEDAYLFGQVRSGAGTEVRIGDGDDSGAMVRIERTGFAATALCDADQLRTIAAHCLAAAEEIDEHKSGAHFQADEQKRA